MEKRIFYHDTDAGGVVYYANYLKYFEEARTLFFEERAIKAHGDFLYAVRSCHITYKAPARYGDILQCETTLDTLSAAQIHFIQKIFRKKDSQLLVSAKITLVSLTPDFKPVILPEPIREKLQAT